MFIGTFRTLLAHVTLCGVPCPVLSFAVSVTTVAPSLLGSNRISPTLPTLGLLGAVLAAKDAFDAPAPFLRRCSDD